MLVFKRAVSLIISFVLVYSPSLAFARGNHHGRFKAESTALYNRQRALQDQKRKATRQATLAKNKSETAKDRSQTTYKSVEAAVGSLYRPVRIDGKDYVMSQVPGKGRKTKAQMIVGNDYREILVDEFNTGTASLWEVTRGDTQVRASHPFRGSFSQIDIRERRAKSFINAHLQLNPDFKTYRVATYTIEPFQVDHYNSGESEVIIECPNQLDPNSAQGVADLKSLLDSVTNSSMTAEAGLTCKLKTAEEELFDSSCFKGDFANSVEDMTKGLAKIFASVTNAASNTTPRYLQCLNQKGFAYNSAQMQANFVKSQEDADRNVRVYTQRALPQTMSCQPLDQLDVYNGSTLVGKQSILDFPRSAFGYKPFTCDGSIKDPAEYRNDISNQFALKYGSTKMASVLGAKDASDAYAQILFHEMLHQSGLSEANNEDLVQNLEKCCASPDPNSADAKVNCAKIDSYTAQQRARQNSEDILSMYMPGYATMRTEVERTFGATKADAVMGRWFAAIQRDPAASAAWTDLQQCIKKDPSNAVACNQAALGPLKKATDEFFSSLGKRNVGDKMMGLLGRKTGATVYADLKTTFDAALTNGANLETQTQIIGNHGVRVNVDHYETPTALELVKTLPVTVEGLVTPAQMMAGVSKIQTPDDNSTTVSEVVVTAPRKKGDKASKSKTAKAGSTTSDSTAVAANGDAQSPATIDDLLAPGGPANLPEATNSQDSGDQGASTASAQADTAPSSTDARSSSDSSSVTPTRPSVAVGSGLSVSKPSSLTSSLETASVASPKPMPQQLSTAGAVPVSQQQALQVGPSTTASVQTSEKLASMGQGLVNAFANSLPQAYAAQVAPAPTTNRMPASASGSTSARVASASSSSGRSLNNDEDRTPVAKSEKAKKSAGGSEQEKVNGTDPDPKDLKDSKELTDRSGDERSKVGDQGLVSAAVLKQVDAAGSDVGVWKALVALDPNALAKDLSQGSASKVKAVLKKKGWSVILKNNVPILKNKSGTCYKFGSRRTLAPAKCE